MTRAADAAAEAFAEWSALNAPARGKYLYKVADILESRLDQLAEVNRKYKLGTTAKNLCELVADAIIWPPRT